MLTLKERMELADIERQCMELDQATRNPHLSASIRGSGPHQNALERIAKLQERHAQLQNKHNG